MTNNEGQQVKNAPTSVTIEKNDNYRESVRKLLQNMIGSALDEDIQEATQKLTEERQKAVEVLVEENKSAIREMIEEGKKIIRARALAVPTSDTFHTDYIEEVITHIYKIMGTPGNGTATETSAPEMPIVPTAPTAPASTAPTQGANSNEWIEIEILPPRGQEEIEAINVYLNSIPQVGTVELITKVDKSIFKVKTSETVDFIWKLRSLPQVLDAKAVPGGDREKIQITLQAKSKIVKTQEEMNAKVKKIFRGKN